MTTTDDSWPGPGVLRVLCLDELPEGSPQRLIESAVPCACWIVSPLPEDDPWWLDRVGRLHDMDCPHSFEAGGLDGDAPPRPGDPS